MYTRIAVAIFCLFLAACEQAPSLSVAEVAGHPSEYEGKEVSFKGHIVGEVGTKHTSRLEPDPTNVSGLGAGIRSVSVTVSTFDFSDGTGTIQAKIDRAFELSSKEYVLAGLWKKQNGKYFLQANQLE
jgi:hypothetical protein